MRIKKRVFLGLLVLSLFFLLSCFWGGWYILTHRTGTWNNILLTLGAITLALILVTVTLGIGGLVLILWRHRHVPFLQHLGLLAANLLFPLALSLGKRMGISADTIKASFIEVNNQLVRLRGIKVKPEQILLVAPHCLQRSDCPYKITIDVFNCRRCGRCSIDALHSLAEKYGVRLAVATGGTMARHFVKFYRPRAVVAIACERDLTSGIQDTQPLPVLGVVNLRPYGPCLNTQVNIFQVEEVIRFFLGLEADLSAKLTGTYPSLEA